MSPSDLFNHHNFSDILQIEIEQYHKTKGKIFILTLNALCWNIERTTIHDIDVNHAGGKMIKQEVKAINCFLNIYFKRNNGNILYSAIKLNCK